jgi:serine/threonine protein phosphatase 1
MSRTFIFGDIHGCFDAFVELMEKIGVRDDDMIISVGDIVDRGGQSKEVYHFFKSRKNSKVIVGNHERKHLNGILSYSQKIVKVQFGNEYESFREWLKTLEYFHITDEAIIVHAAFEHDKTIFEQKEEVLSGSTSGEKYLEKKYGAELFWSDYYKGEKAIIYGHHVVGKNPLVKNNTYGIDTGACVDGYLTAIELPGFIIHQVKSSKDIWKEEQRKMQIPVLKATDWESMEISSIEKQLFKLNYIQEEEVRNYLSGIQNWLLQLEELLTAIKKQLEAETKLLLEIHQENFNSVASQLEYRTFLFKCKSNNLSLADLQKSLETPEKRIHLAQKLGIENLPKR